MKNLKKLFAVALALLMILSLATTAFADEETVGGYSITINNPNAGHTYEAYQIFVADLHNQADPDDKDDTEAILSNIEWGEGVTLKHATNGIVVKKNADGTPATYSTNANTVAVALADGAIDVEDLIAGLVLNAPIKASEFIEPEDESVEDYYIITGLPAGYYLVKDKTGSQDGKFDAYTDYIVEVVENSVVNPKSSVPSVDKYVKDTNDTDGETTDWQISADHDIGDAVPFKIVATLASNVSSFRGPYQLVFQDNMEAGLTYNHDLIIKNNAGTVVYNEKAETGNMEGITVTYEDTALTITIADGKSFGNGAVISLEYTATLNENAIHYTVGNTNSVVLKFANDPTWDADTDPDDSDVPPTGETPPSEVIVYTYKLQVDKVHKNPAYDPSKDDNNEGEDDTEFIPLVGADFTLYKKDANGDYKAVDASLREVKDGSVFIWKGLDDGAYKLSETTTPPGYNTAEDIEFTITAVHDKDKADHVLTLTGDGEMEIVGDALTTSIENKPGAVLPETGGMGTTIFYIMGGVMVAAAVVLLVTKKRMSSAE